MRIVTGALVIRHADYGDSNRMVTLITPKYGKIEAVARGCRRLKSPIVNAAELFTSGEYTLFERNGRLQHRTVSDQRELFRPAAGLRPAGARGLLASAAGRAGAADLPAEEIFPLSLRALAYLNFSELPPALITFAFEAHLMALEGLSPR